MTKTCRECLVDKDVSAFGARSASPDGLANVCKSCKSAYRASRRTAKPAKRTAPKVGTDLGTTGYIASRELMNTWSAVQLIAESGGLAPNLFFIGPSGSGKTHAARHLADVSGLDMVKVDAPSMTDPEAWFGTREVVVEDGASRTVYHPSDFAMALTRPCVLVIDEVNRVADAVRNILLSLFDDSRSATNPITGEPLRRHPACFVVMTGNAGLAFTGTYAIDPALMTRALTTRFDYLDEKDEIALSMARTGCDSETAALFVRFANEARSRAKVNDDLAPISTREVLVACALVAKGLDPNDAANQVVINGASTDGGAESQKASLERIWGGIAPARLSR